MGVAHPTVTQAGRHRADVLGRQKGALVGMRALEQKQRQAGGDAAVLQLLAGLTGSLHGASHCCRHGRMPGMQHQELNIAQVYVAVTDPQACCM